MEPFLGQIQPLGFNFAPVGWATCDGQLLPISSNDALFSLLGTAFGGDGRTTFALPDLRGRSIRHVGTGNGLNSVSWGERGGRETVTLTVNEMPTHNHGGTITLGGAVSGPVGANQFLAANTGAVSIYSNAASGAKSGAVISNQGGGQSFNNLNPFLGVYVSIALQGIYPTRS